MPYMAKYQRYLLLILFSIDLNNLRVIAASNTEKKRSRFVAAYVFLLTKAAGFRSLLLERIVRCLT